MPGFCDRLVDDRAQPAAAEPEDRDGGVLDLDSRMVQVGPVAADLGDSSSISH